MFGVQSFNELTSMCEQAIWLFLLLLQMRCRRSVPINVCSLHIRLCVEDYPWSPTVICSFVPCATWYNKKGSDDRFDDRSGDRAIDSPTDRAIDRTTDRAIVSTIDRAIDRTIDSTIDQTIDRAPTCKGTRQNEKRACLRNTRAHQQPLE